RQGEMKKPRAKLARGFFPTLSEPFSSFLRGASCLKSPRIRSKVQRTIRNRSHKLYRRPWPRQELLYLASGPPASGIWYTASRASLIAFGRSPHALPTREAGHSALRERRFGRARGIMVLPAIMVIGKEDIVEHHGAES